MLCKFVRIGVDLGGTKIELVVLGDDQRVLWRQRIASVQLCADDLLGNSKDNNKEKLENAYQQTLQNIATLLRDAEKEFSALVDLPVGVGTPGSEDSKGKLRNCNSVCLNGKAFRHDLEVFLRRPVRLANDANCFALAEAHMGAAQGANSVFGIILGTGVGGGLVFKGALHEGRNAIAGEWGHNRLTVDLAENRPCYCGRINCIETWLSGPGLSASYLNLAQKKHSAAEVVRAAQQGDKEASAVWVRYCQHLAYALAQVINVIDPEMVVVGGGLSNAADLYQRVPLLWSEHIFSNEISTQLVPAQLGDSAGVFGAAWLW